MENWPSWFNTSKVTIVPFYDRSGLINETLNTLDEALYQQILVTIIVVVIMVLHLQIQHPHFRHASAGRVAFNVHRDENLRSRCQHRRALSGIAIAIGTVVDVGIVLTENIIKHLKDEAGIKEPRQTISHRHLRSRHGGCRSRHHLRDDHRGKFPSQSSP